MNSSVETYQKRLRDEVSLVEQEIESHNQQIETLNSRLEGLRRALELCDSEQSAVAELLRTGVAGLELVVVNPSKASAAASKKSAPVRKAATMRAPAATMRNAQRSAKAPMAGARASSNGAMKRIDMIAAALKRHPRLTVRELIAALERDFGWKCGESNLTAHLYTNPDLFAHTKADRAGKQLVTWSRR
jgi:chromosome segregation ATPase